MDHTAKLVRYTFSGIGLLAICLVSAAVIVGVTDQEPKAKIVRVSTAPTVSSVIYFSITPGIKPAPDGKLHDAYSITNFNVRVGQPIKLVVNNTDDVPHGIEAEAIGVNLQLKPGIHTYTLLVTKAGKIAWHCDFPCDPWSMSHDGYMRGIITAVA
jgi:hypothetical protein